MKTLDETRMELWQAGIKYATACIEAGMTKEAAIEKYISSTTDNIDEDTLAIAKCSIVFAYI